MIPVFNAERYLGDCLRSLACQCLDNFEVIIINDCSTDTSNEIIENWREEMEFRYINNDVNLGAHKSRLAGINASTGDYIMFLDADDMLTTNSLESFYSCLSLSSVLPCIIDGNAKMIGTRHRKIGINFSGNIGPKQYFSMLVDNRQLYQTFKWIRKDLFNGNIAEYDFKIGEDACVITSVISRAEIIVKNANEVYLYRRHIESVTGESVLKSKVDLLKAQLLCLDLAEKANLLSYRTRSTLRVIYFENWSECNRNYGYRHQNVDISLMNILCASLNVRSRLRVLLDYVKGIYGA